MEGRSERESARQKAIIEENYSKIFLANAPNELSQIIKNFIVVGQYEYARTMLLELSHLDAQRAGQLLDELLQLSHGHQRKTASIPSSSHLTWLLITEYQLMGIEGKQISREMLRSVEFNVIIEDLFNLNIITEEVKLELASLINGKSTLSKKATQEIGDAFLQFPVLVHHLCGIVSASNNNIDLIKCLWGIFVDQIALDIDDPASINLLQYLTFPESAAPPNVTSLFEKLVETYFPPLTFEKGFGSPVREAIYSALLALPQESNFAMLLFANVEETVMRRECEKVWNGLAWPFEVLRPVSRSKDAKLILAHQQEFWTQYLNFITISKNHFLEFVVTQFFELIESQRLDECRILLLPFPKLKPLLLLMCFDKMGNNTKFQQDLLDMLWKDEGNLTTPDPKQLNPQLNEKVDALSYQVKLARWASRLLLSKHQSSLSTKTLEPQDRILNEGTKPPRSILTAGCNTIAVDSASNEFDIANVISGMLQEHGVVYILHKYLGEIPLESLESIINDRPEPSSHAFQSSSKPDSSINELHKKDSVHDLTLIYCFYAIKGIIDLVDLAAQQYTEAEPTDALQTSLNDPQSSLQTTKLIVGKIHSPSAQLALLEVMFNFIFLTKECWNSRSNDSSPRKTSDYNSMPYQSNPNQVPDEFVLGPTMTLAIITMIKSCLSPLKTAIQSKYAEEHPLVKSVNNFEKRVSNAEWRVAIIRTRPYFMASTQTGSPNSNRFINVLLAKPESILVKATRERDFVATHAIIEHFNLENPEEKSETEQPSKGAPIALPTHVSHLAAISETIQNIRTQIASNKPLQPLIDQLLNPTTSGSKESTAKSKLETFYLLADISLTANLTSEQSSRTFESAQQLLKQLEPELPQSDFDHFSHYVELLQTLHVARSNGDSQKPSSDNSNTQDPTIMSQLDWLPTGLNNRLMALELWPTSSQSLVGFLQLRFRLQAVATTLHSTVQNKQSSNQVSFSNQKTSILTADKTPFGDSEEFIKKLTLSLTFDEDGRFLTPSIGSVTHTPSKSTTQSAATTPIRDQLRTPDSDSGVSSYIPTPSGDVGSMLSRSNIGESYLFTFLRQLLMIGATLRSDANIGKANFFDLLHTTPKHLLAELVYESRDYSKAEYLANGLELELIPMLLELMGMPKLLDSNNSHSSSTVEDSAFDAPSQEHRYTLNMNLVDYLKQASPLIASLACIMRPPTDKFDERFLQHALISTKKQFPPLHRWLRVKLRQFGVFYHTSLVEDSLHKVNYPVGSDFVALAENPNTPSNSSNNKISSYHDQSDTGARSLRNQGNSFRSGSYMGSFLGRTSASPTSSMNELGITGGLHNNAMLRSRAAAMAKNSSGRLESSEYFNADEEEDDVELSQIPGSFSPRSRNNRMQQHERGPSNSSDENDEQGLKTYFSSVDILDYQEAVILEHIFQDEGLKSEYDMYTKAAETLASRGLYAKAVQLADASLPTGAPDSLLMKLVETTQDKALVAGYILRMNNKENAAKLALQMVPQWDIPTVTQVLFMCECHLEKLKNAKTNSQATTEPVINNIPTKLQAPSDESTQILSRVKEMHDRMLRYAEVLDVTKGDVQSRWKTWQELDELAHRDLAVVVQLLLNIGNYDVARRLAEHFKNAFLKIRVEEKYLLHLLETGDTRGVRMRLRSLEGEEAIRIAQSLMDLVATNADRLFLTQFILERKSQSSRELVSSTTGSSSTDVTLLSATELGLKILLCLPPELQKVFQPLMSSPSVILESLLVSEQTLVLNKIFKEVPQVAQDYTLVFKYARKALDATRLISVPETPSTHTPSSNPSSQHSSKAPTPRGDDAQSEEEVVPGYAPEASGAFSGHNLGSSSKGSKPISRVSSSTTIASTTSGGTAPPKLKMNLTAAKSLITPDERKEHVYTSAPNYPLAAGILDLCNDSSMVASVCIEISDNLSAYLHCVKDRLFVVRIIQQLLTYAKLRIMSAEPTDDEGKMEADAALLQSCEMLLQRTELLLQLIFCGGTATASAVIELSKSLSLSMLADPQKARALRERLIENDMADLALLVANKCGVETEPIWAAKALRMLETNRYQEAKQLFRYCLVSAYPQDDGGTDDNFGSPSQQKPSSGPSQPSMARNTIGRTNRTIQDNTTILTKIIAILETNVPLEQDKLAARRTEIYNWVKPPANSSPAHTKTHALLLKRFKGMEDVDSSDSAVKYLGTLKKPTTGSLGMAQKKHTLDSVRYMQCIYYLQRFGTEELIFQFWLRHGLLEDCLRHLDSKPLPIDTKLLLIVINYALSHNLFPRFKDALFKVDPILEKWRDAMLFLCVHFHQAKMPVLLLEIQLCMKDYTRAGLTCMQLVTITNSTADKLRYLDMIQRYFAKALENFDEYSQLQQHEDSSTPRVPMTKMDLSKNIKTAQLQARLVEFMESLAPTKSNPTPDTLPPQASLFGTTPVRASIVELLVVNHNFDLAYKIIQEFRLPADRIYKDAVIKMAKRKQHKKIEELLKMVKIVLQQKDLDACSLAATRVYGLVHNDYSTAESFSSKIVDPTMACEALIACRKLKQAYLAAVKLGDLDLVRAVMQEAKTLDLKREYELCEAFLKSKHAL